MKKVALFFLYLSSLSAFSMKEQIERGQSGDFIVSERDKRGELLRIHTLENDTLILEEIAFPSTLKLLGTKAWQEWIGQGAPGHTSWTLIEINLTHGTLLECFSFTRNAFLEIQETDLLFLKILPLSLKSLPPHERKKIGPPPVEGADNRKLWNPELIFDGKKKKGVPCNVFSFLYPKETSPLSEKQFELYYDAENKDFPFPYLIKITDDSSASYNIRVIDSGRGLATTLAELPRRAITFTKAKEITKEGVVLHLDIPSYYKGLEVFAVNQEDAITTPLSYKKESEKSATTLVISKEELKKKLSPDASYTFRVSASTPLWTSAEAKEPFVLLEKIEDITR